MAGEDSFLALSLFTATTTFLLSDNIEGSNFVEFCVMGYCFKASEGIAYLEWLRVDAEAMAADLDREIKEVQERTDGVDSPWIRDARRRLANLRLSCEQLRHSGAHLECGQT